MIVPDRPPFLFGRPLLMLGLTAGAAAVALWFKKAPRPAAPRVEKPLNPEPKRLRVEPAERVEETLVDVPWVREPR